MLFIVYVEGFELAVIAEEELNSTIARYLELKLDRFLNRRIDIIRDDTGEVIITLP